MSRRKALVAVICLVAAGAALALLSRSNGVSPDHASTRLSTIGAELFHLDAGSITRRGPSTLWVLRLSGPVELVPYHFRAAGLDAPQPVEVWADHLVAPVVLNAGQFDEDLNHLGWLRSNGTWLNERQHAKWKGILVSGPVEGAPWAGVLDLERSNADIVESYRHVIQSMMLIDDEGKLRVRDSDLSACRTVVAQDRRGRLLIMVSEGAMTLADLARWIPTAGLGVVRAMNLDGGIESQLAVRTSELELALYGQYGTGTTVFDAGPGQIRYPLPSVIAVQPVPQSP